ncbi:IMP dehydrogenase [Candidatus Micrarchaeota archaeon]|nr:IMP dehydrogenase [Candidatus Micrarchaeota archaeon]
MLTFDDVLLVPSYSEVFPAEVKTGTLFTRKISMNIPLISSPMDTVTESGMAIAIAREGGIGVVHRNLPVEEQVHAVEKVKKSESWVVKNPLTVSPEDTISKVFSLVEQYEVSSFPVLDGEMLVGIITTRDLMFHENPSSKVRELMTSELITGRDGITIEEAKEVLKRNRIEKLPIVDKTGRLRGLITARDIEKGKKFPNSCKDEEGRLRVGGATGPSDFERARALVAAGADAIVIDTAHGHTKAVLDGVKNLRREFGDEIQIVAGNIVTEEGVDDLVSAGVDAIKVGLGAGAICTTRIVSGAGMPQFSAIVVCAEAAKKHGVPLIADGGIRYSGDIVKALGAGAHSVMLGSMLAGTEEAPGKTVFSRGRKYKEFRGMGSLGAMTKGARDRYFQGSVMQTKKLVPEGIEGIVPYKGAVSEVIYQIVGGLRSGMGYCGAKSIDELREKAKFVRISKASYVESHPHDVTITQEAPNYQSSEVPQ